MTPTRCTIPIVRQIPELTIQNVTELPGKYGTITMKASPRRMYTPVMAHSTPRRNGKRGMMPAPENAYSDQIVKTPAITNAATVGYQCPAAAIRAMRSPAPRKRNHDAPKTMQPRWNSAAMALKVPPAIKYGLMIVCMTGSLVCHDDCVIRIGVDDGKDHGVSDVKRISQNFTPRRAPRIRMTQWMLEDFSDGLKAGRSRITQFHKREVGAL